MTSPTPRQGLPRLSTRKHLLTASVLSTVVLLSACSTPTTPVESATTKDSAATTTAAAAASPATSPPPSSTSPATSSSAPSAESAVKELVAGFPSTVLPLMKGAEIQASSLVHGSPVSVASLTATVKATPATVLTSYTTVLTKQGFKAQPGDAVDGVPLKTFVRAEGQEIVTVSVVQTGSTATFTLGATLLPASFK